MPPQVPQTPVNVPTPPPAPPAQSSQMPSPVYGGGGMGGKKLALVLGIGGLLLGMALGILLDSTWLHLGDSDMVAKTREVEKDETVENTDEFEQVQARARDTERKVDINAMHAQIEAHHAQNGLYPTKAQMSDTDWVIETLVGLDVEAMNDPKGGRLNAGG